MTRLEWGLDENRKHEAGVDRGVLYPPEAPGVVWNGLVSVVESFDGGEVDSYHFDGVKYVDLVSPRAFKATVTAFSAPEEFLRCVGEVPMFPGFIFTRQPRSRFGMSYRTNVGADLGYKIHLVYNALAKSNGKTYSSLTQTPSATPFEWSLDTIPLQSDGTFRPSAHFIFDTTQMSDAAVAEFESVLYGTDSTHPRLPDLDELIEIVLDLGTLVVVPDTVGGIAELVDGFGAGDLARTRVDGVLKLLPDTRLVDPDADGFYELEP